MMLVEFIEAIARVSEKLNIPHFILEKTIDYREERSLSIKLEAFIIFIARYTLSNYDFTNYVKGLKKIIESDLKKS